MRIGTDSIASNTLFDITAATERMTKAQDVIGTGRRINKPSDDPSGVGQSISIRNALQSIEQYQRNISAAKGFMGVTDNALSSTGDLTRQARSLAVQAATDTLDPSARQGIVQQLSGIIDQVAQLGNTKYDDRFVFGGQRTTTQPFQNVNGSWQYQGGSQATGDGSLAVEIAPGSGVNTNVPGDQVFSKVISTLTSVRDHIASGSVLTISKEDLSALDDAVTAVSGARVDLGARVQQLDNTNARLSQSHTDLTSYLSRVEDADIPQAVVALQGAQTAYQAALAVTARSFQQSLLDFLK